MIKSEKVIVVSHYPSFYDPANLMESMTKHHGFALGVTLEQEPPEGMYYDASGNAISIRQQTVEGKTIVITSGAGTSGEGGHKEEHFKKLEELTRQRFPVKEVVYKWHTHDYSTKDGIPYIGQLDPEQEGVFVATGFGGWGMTTGHVAATILRDRILGEKSSWEKLYDPFTRDDLKKG